MLLVGAAADRAASVYERRGGASSSFCKKVVDGQFKVPIMRTTPSDEALKELENQVLTDARG